MSMALNGFLWVIAGLWLAGSALCAWAAAMVRVLPRLDEGKTAPGGAAGSRVSVIVAARDEEERIEQAVRRLLAQRGIECEVIVVNDRSADGTEAILRELAEGDARLQVVHVTDLPAGWLGKCHALDVGARRATGDWLLFSDADTWLADDVVARAVSAGERDKADHVTLMPGFKSTTLLGRATVLGFGPTLLKMMARVNADWRYGYCGIGAFNMIRRAAYERIGRHERLRLEVVDDMKLGLLVRRERMRTRAYFAGWDVEVDWGGSPRGMLRVLEKNHFAMTRFNWALALGAVVFVGGVWIAAALGPLTGTWAGIAAGLGLLSMAVPCGMLSRRYGWGWLPALLAPLTMILFAVSIANSTVVTLRQGGVRWRDTFYPLRTLREGQVR